ncbi:uncharacterized protein LOC115987882 [Quercus lobata]|uniref:uncharacterized protein LOC115987882 n=1 Tax=Quercus lobata TaxID=97700 RepID=UPI001247D2B4|nr:uncharacterized protein LOC115987882 [Quercus lobata]
MVSINCLLFVSVEVRLFLEWFLSTLLRLFQPTISLRKMGLISRKIFPTCESMCVCCPALRSSSRQPVKRYKKLLAEIFPKSLIAKYLEERCYKELRVEHIKFINIVWERFTGLAAEVEAAKIERDNFERKH